MILKTIKCNSPQLATFDAKNKNIITTESNNLFIYDNKMDYSCKFKIKNAVEFQKIGGICLQPSTNNIIMSDAWANNIKVLLMNDHKEFEYLYSIEEKSQNSRIKYPHKITCNRRGYIIFINWSDETVQILDEKGIFIRQINIVKLNDTFHNTDSMYDVCVMTNQILISDHLRKRISIWSGDGSQFIRDVYIDDYPVCLTVDRFNRPIIGLQEKIVVFDINFNKLQYKNENLIQQFDGIDSLCVNDANNLIVCDPWARNIHLLDLDIE